MSKTGKIQVLLVEDQPIVSVAGKIMLSLFDCCVTDASDGKMAFEKASSQDYDLIFLDLGLSDLTGAEVARKIRALPDVKKCNVPIVALTGHESEEVVKECFDAGMNQVLSKPLQKSLLESVFRQWVYEA